MANREEQDSIPTGKVERAAKFVATGARIGGNYLKHYAKKMVNPELSREELHRDNAEDIYNSLSQLKGSALKVAQMLSMDSGVLPQQYVNKFSQAQYQAPPLSAPLVIQTFRKSFGKTPSELFDHFQLRASHAASIGQVHQAEKDGQLLAVKVQYPGVAESIRSDLNLVKPIALRMFSLNEKDLNKYMGEVEERLMEETDYRLELKRSVEMSEACKAIDGLLFPRYYPELSSNRVLTMDWMSGFHLGDFLATNPNQETRDKIGQLLWDFYDFQIHTLKAVHADPHPGNFLFHSDGRVGVIDFGCIKLIPEDFYFDYFALLLPEVIDNEPLMIRQMNKIEMLYTHDDAHTRQVLVDNFIRMTRLLGQPFRHDTFDFGDKAYMASIYVMGEEISQVKEIRNSKESRGSKHTLYINRTYFGIYSMLHQLKARVTTGQRNWRIPLLAALAEE